MIDLSAIPFRQARWYTKVTGERFIDYVVLHTMQFWERSDSAEWCQDFFATSDRKGSTHMCVDNDSIARCVLDKDVCWGANGVNHDGLHIEHAGFAEQDEVNWHDEYSQQMLRLSAELTATWCALYDIPPVFVDADGLRRHVRGITTHREAEIAFPYGGHTDPGPEFPINQYIEMVKFFLGVQMASLTVHESELRTSVVGGPMTLDFTYLPTDGSKVGESTCLSYVVVRSVGMGVDQDAEVWFDGELKIVRVPGDGRTVALPVTRAGLTSVVGRGIVAKARELWV
jgi:hypothetical protein